MARYKIILAYDGRGFTGSQRQARARTVQGELEGALRRIGWTGRSVLLAGRTDAGVHASGQVASFDLEWGHTAGELRDALNATLPPDLATRQVEQAPPGFHPRFDASSRLYRYELFCGAVRDPLAERLAWRVWPGFDGALLGQMPPIFLGRHDFAAFGSPVGRSGNTVRTILRAEWRPGGAGWQLDIQADAFLYRMVRRLVFVQVAAAQGRCTIEDLRRALELGGAARSTRAVPAGLAPAHGLTLMEVTYPPLEVASE
jgi:tRNA pseudouridine38-40 synthase